MPSNLSQDDMKRLEELEQRVAALDSDLDEFAKQLDEIRDRLPKTTPKPERKS